MKQVELFFDYACPYCLGGYEALLEVLNTFEDVEMRWSPCEAHPRPETYGPHSDLCIMGLFFVQDTGGDVWEYHKRMFAAACGGEVDIESIGAVVALVADMLDGEALRAALEDGRYTERLNAANDYAYEESGVWAVPVLRCEGRRVDAVENVGVTREQIAQVVWG